MVGVGESWYSIAMPGKKRTVKKGSASGHVVGRGRFAKISAVEGITLSEAMQKRAETSKKKGLTAAETRSVIMRAYRKG